MRPYKTISGELVPSGMDERFRYALLTGAVRLTKDEDSAAPGDPHSTEFSKRLASLRGVIEGAGVSPPMSLRDGLV